MASGRRAGWYAAIGFHLAGFGHIAAAAFGITIFLQMIPAFFVIMKAIGAAYLIWLGVRSLIGQAPLAGLDQIASNAEATRTLKHSIVVEALNPKSALFFLAFLPQFTDPSAADLPVWTQIVVLGIIVNVIFTVGDLILIEISDLAARRARTSGPIVRVFQRISGGVLIALGVNLASAWH
jgi:threonine/homoserine/homoserine lactone efflux protein